MASTVPGARSRPVARLARTIRPRRRHAGQRLQRADFPGVSRSTQASPGRNRFHADDQRRSRTPAAVIYFDTSHLVRLYYSDPGAESVRALAATDHVACAAHAVLPLMEELSTQAAAHLLGVSRQFFVRECEGHKLPSLPGNASGRTDRAVRPEPGAVASRPLLVY